MTKKLEKNPTARACRHLAQIQIAASYYVPWQEQQISAAPDALRLKVMFGNTSARPGEFVTCAVNVERVGFRGRGMMIAEIGLPPGVDVDRRSLDDALANAVGVDHYDILPDKVLLYLWPTAGGTKFVFRFQPRMAMKALSAASLLYDYYNPDARVVVKPVRFNITAQ